MAVVTVVVVIAVMAVVVIAIIMLVSCRGMPLCGWPHANGLVWIVLCDCIVQNYRVDSIVYPVDYIV